jgi:hypothetical protein
MNKDQRKYPSSSIIRKVMASIVLPSDDIKHDKTYFKKFMELNPKYYIVALSFEGMNRYIEKNTVLANYSIFIHPPIDIEGKTPIYLLMVTYRRPSYYEISNYVLSRKDNHDDLLKLEQEVLAEEEKYGLVPDVVNDETKDLSDIKNTNDGYNPPKEIAHMVSINNISSFFAEDHHKIHVCPRCLSRFTSSQALENHITNIGDVVWIEENMIDILKLVKSLLNSKVLAD